MTRRSVLYIVSFFASVCASATAGGCAPASPPPTPAPVASAAEPQPSPDAELGEWIDAYASAFGKNWGEGYAFSGYLAVVRDGAIVFGKAYGKADREKGTAAAPGTRFRIGSLTKQFTAAAILKLAEQGKIKLDDPIKKYIYEAPASWKGITIHHLLTHTSGISTYTIDNALMMERDKPHPQAQVIAAVVDRPLDFEPGAKFQYSNSGYFLLGVAIQRITGAPYGAYLQENVLRPAGMARTSVEDAPDEPDAAKGYTVSDEDAVVPAHPADMSLPFAAGALRSTADDLAAWDRALAGTAVLSEASKQRMFTVEKADYAYGVNRTRFAGHDVLSHSGAIDGFTAYFARALDARVAVIALSNNDRFEAKQVGGAALEMALTHEKKAPPKEKKVAPFDAAFAARVVGEYRLTEESRKALSEKVPKEIIDSAMGMTISLEGDRLFMKPSGQQRVRVFAGTDGSMFTKQDPLDLVIEPAADKAAPVKAITLVQAGVSGRYERAPAETGGW